MCVEDPTTLRGVGIPAWVWFVIGVVAIGVGVALLIVDRSRHTSNNRERRRWAALRGWQFAEADQVLPTRWERGVVRKPGATALDVVAGSTFTADGRRQVYVLDLDFNGKSTQSMVAVRCRRPTSATVELWQPDVPVPQDTDLDLLGPVGSRYAFVSDIASARRMVTPDMVEAVEEIGGDVTVVWLENDWVLAALDPEVADPSRLERLLRSLGELADLVDPFETDPNEPVAEPEAETVKTGTPVKATTDADESEADAKADADTERTERTDAERAETEDPDAEAVEEQDTEKLSIDTVAGRSPKSAEGPNS